MRRDEDRWRPRPGTHHGPAFVGEEVAKEVDREGFDPAVRNLLSMIVVHASDQAFALRERIVILGSIQAILLGLILWRVW